MEAFMDLPRPAEIVDIEGSTPVAGIDDGVVLTVTGDKMSWLEKFFFDAGHFLGIGGAGAKPLTAQQGALGSTFFASYTAAKQYHQGVERKPDYRPTMSDDQRWASAMVQANSQVNREFGGFLAVTAGGAAALAAAGPSLLTFALSNAYKISSATGKLR